MPMAPLYVSATKQDTGKTTLMIGLVQAARKLGHDVGYIKPVGQRYVEYEGKNVDEDAVLAREAFDLEDDPADLSPIAIERGFTERYIFNREPDPLEERIQAAYDRLQNAHEYVLVEGTGHAGVGSCFDLSNARVAEILGAKVIIVAGGGIGRAIDEVTLSLHLFHKHNVEVLGVVLNKVWPEKADKVCRAVGEGLQHIGTRLLGAIPYRRQLGQPAVEQIAEELQGSFISGKDHADNRVEHTVVAAMSPQHVCLYLRDHTLVVTPGDRVDEALTDILTHPESHQAGRIAGLVLTGGFMPEPEDMRQIRAAGIPVILCDGDTYTVATALRDLVFKIRPQDTEKIDAARELVRQTIDVQAVLDMLT